ncbi:MAG: tagaturonate reductase [Eubacterium sp.]|nr:tagaturonate reductase [Eubacterium sp.]
MKETIIQFGTGNFLRGFADYFVDEMNKQGLYDGKIAVVSPTNSKTVEVLNQQNCIYNLYLRGIENGEEVCRHTEIHSITRAINPYADFDAYLALAHNPDFRFIISNTTEAGIEYVADNQFEDKPAKSFPAKLTQLLYERFKAGLNGFVILACELIDHNGEELQNCVLNYAQQWNLGEDFYNWIVEENKFCNTLVDRIVTGYPKDEAEALCPNDALLDTAEIYHFWAIEGNYENELPLQKAGFNVIWTDNIASYKKRKVRVLNGAHTSMVIPAMLCGVETVGECLKDELINRYLKDNLFTYILPVIGENADNIAFANAVLERFANPYIKHLLKSISLNSVSKFSVRVLPTILDYKNMNGSYPKPLVFSLACLIEYYKKCTPQDNENLIEFIKENDVKSILSNADLWGSDLSDMLDIVEESLDKIHSVGIREAIEWALS